jgi:hypothetical protein
MKINPLLPFAIINKKNRKIYEYNENLEIALERYEKFMDGTFPIPNTWQEFKKQAIVVQIHYEVLKKN